jgi:probable HAF family extracellular repeat protein
MLLLNRGSSSYCAGAQQGLQTRVSWIRLLFLLIVVALGKPAGDVLAAPEITRGFTPPIVAKSRIQPPAQLTSAVLMQGNVAIEQFLPGSLPLSSADCFRTEGSEVFDFISLLARFPDVPDAASTLQSLGWQAGANRKFACDTPPLGTVGWVDMSVHRFVDARSAQAAVPFFATSRALSTALAPAAAAQLGDASSALTGDAGNGTEYTLYVAQGSLLFRVTGVASTGNPRPDVEAISAGLITGSIILGESESAPAFPQTSGASYSIVDLGTGYGNWGSARLINNQGDVVLTTGSANYADSNLFHDRITDSRVYLWRNGQNVDLSSSGLEFVRALNDEGQVLGGNGKLNLVLDTATMEPELIPGFENSGFPASINNNGTIVGNSDGVTLLTGLGDRTSIPMPSGYGFMLAQAVSDSNQVVGVVMPGPGDDADQRGFLYQDGAMILLGTAPGASSSQLHDINDTGQAVGGPGVRGMHSVLQYGRAFSFDTTAGNMSDLGTLPGYQNSNAMALNNQGQAVGIAWFPIDESDVIRRAVLFDTRTGDVIDLNLAIPQGSGWWLADAHDINDNGQIVGRGYLNGESHAFLLTPATS